MDHGQACAYADAYHQVMEAHLDVSCVFLDLIRVKNRKWDRLGRKADHAPSLTRAKAKVPLETHFETAKSNRETACASTRTRSIAKALRRVRMRLQIRIARANGYARVEVVFNFKCRFVLRVNANASAQS